MIEACRCSAVEVSPGAGAWIGWDVAGMTVCDIELLKQKSNVGTLSDVIFPLLAVLCDLEADEVVSWS